MILLLCLVGLAFADPAAETCSKPTLCGEYRFNSHGKPDDPVPNHGGTGNNFVIRYNKLKAATTEVDVVVYLHGYTRRRNEDCTNANFAISGITLNTVTRPTVAIFARGKPTPTARRADAYDHPDVYADGGLDHLISFSLRQLSAAKFSSNCTLTRSRLIVAAHSGGGKALTRLLDSYRAQINAAIGFDCTYYGSNQMNLYVQRRWAQDSANTQGKSEANIRTYMATDVRAGTVRNFVTSGTTANYAAQVRWPSADNALAAYYRNEATKIAHINLPDRLLACLLGDLSAACGASPVDENDQGPCTAGGAAGRCRPRSYCQRMKGTVSTIAEGAIGCQRFQSNVQCCLGGSEPLHTATTTTAPPAPTAKPAVTPPPKTASVSPKAPPAPTNDLEADDAESLDANSLQPV